MGDQAALQEAIQRARQLAAKMSQNVPVKRTASEIDDHTTGTVKVTLAYEKPANSDLQREQSREQQREPRAPSHRDNDHAARGTHHSRDRERDRERGDRHDRDRDSSAHSNNGSTHGQSRGNSHGPSFGYGTGANSTYSSDDRIEIIIPHAVIGLVIGKGGENIKRIQNETGATVRVDPNTVDEKGNKVCTITGSKQAVQDAHAQVSHVIENAGTSKRPRMQVDGSDSYKMKIPASRTGAIIGKGGETIKNIKQQSGCDIELDKSAKECGPDESIFIIRGTPDKIAKARSMIEARLASRGRDGDRPDRGPKGVATGANAAPVAPYPDLPTTYPAAGQQNPDMSTAWTAYFAQYSNMFNQAGAAAQPNAMSLLYGQNLAGATASPQQQMVQNDQSQLPPQPQQLQPTQPAQPPAVQAGGQPQQDYTDQWIEFYLANGRPDYAEQIIEMKKQQQAQKQQQSSVGHRPTN